MERCEKKYLSWFVVGLLVFAAACGGKKDPKPAPKVDPDQVREIVGIYKGDLQTTRKNYENQHIQLNKVNDSTVKVSTFAGGSKEAITNFNMRANDLSVVGDQKVVLRIFYQIVGKDTVQGFPKGKPGKVKIHGFFDKKSKELNYSIEVNTYNEQIKEAEVIHQVFKGKKVK